MPSDARDEGGDGALHVAGAAAIQDAVPYLGGKGVVAPVRGTHRHYVGVAGEAEMPPAGAQARVQILDLPVFQAMDREPQAFQCARQYRLRSTIGRRDRVAADQFLRQREGVEEVHQSRSSSLMDVFARVCASTIFTITAQYNDGPGEPSGSGRPGSEPGTTTE